MNDQEYEGTEKEKLVQLDADTNKWQFDRIVQQEILVREARERDQEVSHQHQKGDP